jgi:hypothetical protein
VDKPDKEASPSTSTFKPTQQSVTPSISSFCDARVYIPTDLVVKQCSRSKLPNCNFCKSHQNLFEVGKLKWGTVHEAKPDAISTEKLNMKVKRTIY